MFFFQLNPIRYEDYSGVQDAGNRAVFCKCWCWYFWSFIFIQLAYLPWPKSFDLLASYKCFLISLHAFLACVSLCGQVLTRLHTCNCCAPEPYFQPICLLLCYSAVAVLGCAERGGGSEGRPLVRNREPEWDWYVYVLQNMLITMQVRWPLGARFQKGALAPNEEPPLVLLPNVVISGCTMPEITVQ